MRFRDTCENACHRQVKSKLRKVDKYLGYNFYSENIVLVTTSFEHVENLLIEVNSPILEFAPLIPATKMDRYVQNRIYPTIKKFGVVEPTGGPNAENCFSYFINIAPMTPQSMDAFVVAMDTLSEIETHRFDWDRTYLKVGEDSMITVSMRISKTSGQTLECSAINDRLVLESIANFNEVIWIERRFPIIPWNRWAKGVCQSGDPTNVPLFGSKVNLTGHGEIIGVADTGIDKNNCYFNDPDHHMPYNTINMNHRKVVTYISYADRIDDEESHGTHVAGTVLGYSSLTYGDFPRYNGHAPNAKVAFMDIGRTGQTRLNTPANIYSEMFTPMYAAGARIMTNSWGSGGENTYNNLAAQVDKFMWDHPGLSRLLFMYSFNMLLIYILFVY